MRTVVYGIVLACFIPGFLYGTDQKGAASKAAGRKQDPSGLRMRCQSSDKQAEQEQTKQSTELHLANRTSEVSTEIPCDCRSQICTSFLCIVLILYCCVTGK